MTTTRIDFHSNVADKLHYTCRLIRKAYAAGCPLVVFHPDRRILQQLDQALWTLGEAEFLPHVMADDALAVQTPVILSHSQLAGSPHFELLINLSSDTPDHFSGFSRVIEIVSQDPEETAAGRDRYRYYQQQGYALSHHVAS